MRFIHTADWHLGNQMHEIDRRKEFSMFLSWLKDLITEKSADSLVIAGDIFDTVNPSIDSRRQYYT
ncbi:MAG: metallophosphoesterase, partial [Treponema sp.]|nr:metallophosphoesterase [Treponema sp.]